MPAQRLPLAATVAAVGLLTGCLGPLRAQYRSSQPVSIADRSPDADRLWEAIQETLRRHRFLLDRVDRRAGIVTTMPVTSQHFFEFWRHDVNSAPDLWESTLNPLRRWVAVTLKRGADSRWEEVSVVVHKERLSSPDRQFNSTGEAYQYFGDTLPSTTGSLHVAPEETVWLEQERDHAMEEYLLDRVLDRAGLSVAAGNARDSDQ